jgi:hypothetical protein
MRGLTSTIALVVVGAGLGGYIYFVESKRPAGALETKEKVFTVEADALEELSVTSQGETTTLRKEGGTWKITAPITADADATEVSNLTSALTSLEVNRVIDENASNLAEYGLAEPRVRLAYKAKGGSGEVHIGEKTATQSDLYAMKAGEKRVFLLSAYQETSLAKKTFDLRDKRVLHFERDKVDTIELAQPGSPTVQLVRSGSEWVLEQPIAARGDYSGIEGLLTRLSTASMTTLVDPNSPEDFGLEKPTAAVTLGAGSSRATLEFGTEKDGAVYTRDRARPTMVFTVEPSLATDVKKPVADFRDKDLFEFRMFNVLRLRIARGADTYEFQKVTGTGTPPADKWQRMVDGKPVDVDTTKMEDLLSKASNLRAQSFNPTTTAAGSAPPSLVISASYDTAKFERVRFIRNDKEALGMREGEAGVAVLDSSSYDETVKALDAVLAPPPPPAPAPTNATPPK